MIYRLLLVSIVAAISISLFAQDSITVQMKVPGHPRLFLLKGQEKALLQRINKDAQWSQVHQTIMAQSEKMLTQPVNERVMEGRRLLHVSRSVLKSVLSLSYAYRLTGDARYSDRAVKEMLKAASFEDWNPSHFLDVAEMTLALAIGYDWNFDCMDTATRSVIRQAIIEKGLQSSMVPKNNAWLKSENNWNQVCNAGISLGALAVYEEDPDFAVQLLNRAIRSLPLAMAVYAADGAYPEGATYWAYGTTFNCIFLDAIEKIYKSDFGLTRLPGFLPSGLFLQAMITPSLGYFAHSDCRTDAAFEPAVFWFYGKTKAPELMFFQSKLLEKVQNNVSSYDRVFPFAVLWGVSTGASLSKTAVPKNLMWFTQSDPAVAVMRSTWSSPHALYLGFKGGSPFVNHAHMDGGSFYLEAQGVKWGMDLGMHEYHTLEKNGVALFNRAQHSQRWDIFRISNMAHNTISINNEKHLVAGNVPIEKVSTSENLMYVTGNLSSLYGNNIGSVQRAVGMVDKSYVLVEDHIVASEKPAAIRWNMTTEADSVIPLSPQLFLLTHKEKKLFVRIEGIDSVQMYFKPALPSLPFEMPYAGASLFGFEFNVDANNTKKIKVYLMPEKEYMAQEHKFL